MILNCSDEVYARVHFAAWNSNLLEIYGQPNVYSNAVSRFMEKFRHIEIFLQYVLYGLLCDEAHSSA